MPSSEESGAELGVTIVVPSEKPHLGEALDQALSLMSRAASGDPQAHKAATFGLRYSGTRYADQDPRVYSRDPDEIRSYWADRGVAPRSR